MSQTINDITHETFYHEHQPNRWCRFEVDHVEAVEYPPRVPEDRWDHFKDYMRHRADNGWVRVHGVIVEGKETSRLFQHTNTKDLAGQAYTIEVPPSAWEAGRYVTIAM